MTTWSLILSRVRAWGVNTLIVLLVVAMLAQSLPLNMPATTLRVRYLADWIGIGHPPWDLYAPVPDHQNHRISAELIAGDDHVIARWHSPEWRKQSAAKRFCQHRWTEYYDNIWGINNAPLWPSLARYIVASTPQRPFDPDERPTQVKLIAETRVLSDPQGNRWPAPVPPEGYGDNWVLSIEPLP